MGFSWLFGPRNPERKKGLDHRDLATEQSVRGLCVAGVVGVRGCVPGDLVGVLLLAWDTRNETSTPGQQRTANHSHTVEVPHSAVAGVACSHISAQRITTYPFTIGLRRLRCSCVGQKVLRGVILTIRRLDVPFVFPLYLKVILNLL